MDRLNNLKKYLDFYKKEGFWGSPSQFPGFTLGGPTQSFFDKEALNWATQQAAGDSQEYKPDSPNFFSNMGSGMRMAQNNQQSQYPPIQQYQSPKINPYSERATQLNNDPYSGQGDQNGIMNYLRRMMGGSGQIGQGQGMTVGIRG